MKINYLAVLTAAVAHFIIGGLWYGLLFGNKFIQLMGWSQQQLEQVSRQSHARDYLAAFVSSLVISYVLSHFLHYTRAQTAFDGIQTVFWLWLGFVVTTQLATVVFELRNPGLYLLNVGYQLVACTVAGVILTVWRVRKANDTAAEVA